MRDLAVHDVSKVLSDRKLERLASQQLARAYTMHKMGVESLDDLVRTAERLGFGK